jgi:hypothetical protein
MLCAGRARHSVRAALGRMGRARHSVRAALERVNRRAEDCPPYLGDALRLVAETLLMATLLHALAALVLGNFRFASFFEGAHSGFQIREPGFNHLIRHVATHFFAPNSSGINHARGKQCPCANNMEPNRTRN